jgi:glutaminyl-peptide cyclotransferase
MLMDLAESLTPLLAARKERVDGGRAILRPGFDEEEAAETTLQIVFFDGEEAFHDWTDTDSIYGARWVQIQTKRGSAGSYSHHRHLAELWEDTFLPPQHPLMARRMGPNPTVLNTIDTLVLLDLLGSKSPRIYSYFRETDWLHGAMSSADERLRKAQLVQVERGEDGWFPMARMNKGMIGDDHVPVSISLSSDLHLATLHPPSSPPPPAHPYSHLPVPTTRSQHPPRHLEPIPESMAYIRRETRVPFLRITPLIAGRRDRSVHARDETVESDLTSLHRRIPRTRTRDSSSK